MPRPTVHQLKQSTKGTVRHVSRVNDGIRALNRVLTGEKLSDIRQSDLAWLESKLGLSKPLASYSVRSRQKFLSAAAQGRTAQQERERERTRRKQRAQTRPVITNPKWRIINAKRDRIRELGVDVDPYLDDEIIAEVAKYYGVDYLVTVLTQQVESTEKYVFDHQREPGHSRWNARGELEDRFRIAIPEAYLIGGTDPYYYYHGRQP